LRHASIQTTMNVYGRAMTDTKRPAHRKAVELVLKPSKTKETPGEQKPVKVIGSEWELEARSGTRVTD
jgi:hypothetical protein